MNSLNNKERQLFDLSNAVKYCDLCERLKEREKVLSVANGNINSRVLFIAEAPGRLGADKTLIPLFGDKSGDNFESLLGNIGWKREQVFITNAILCNPRSEDGNNSTPTTSEIHNCSCYLEMTINLVKPDVIVTLGTKALDALSLIEKHDYKLKENVGELLKWNRFKLMPLYHTGPRAVIHRSMTKQRADFIKLSKYVHPIDGLKEKIRQNKHLSTATPSQIDRYDKVASCISYVMEYYKKLTFFKLTKLLYLIDFKAIESFGHTLTGSIYIRQEAGPWCPDLIKILKQPREWGVQLKGKESVVYVNKAEAYPEKSLLDDEISLVLRICEECADLDDSKIKIRAYSTKPMKYILRQEKEGRDMRKVPVIYGNKTAIELDSAQTL